MTNLKVKVEIQIDLKQIAYLLCCAMEGGSNYWYFIPKYKKPDNPIAIMNADDPHPEIYPHIDYALQEGGGIYVDDSQVGEEGTLEEPFLLDLESIKKGLMVMAEKYPYHFQNFMAENEDADTGDCFLQCCVFGELVYG